MDDLSKYEKELLRQLEDLPVPDEGPVWDEIASLLDKQGDRGGIILPPSGGSNFFRKYLSLLILVLLCLLGYIFYTVKQYNAASDPTKMVVQEINTIPDTNNLKQSLVTGSTLPDTNNNATGNIASQNTVNLSKKVTVKIQSADINSEPQSAGKYQEGQSKSKKILKGKGKRTVTRNGSLKTGIKNADPQYVNEDPGINAYTSADIPDTLPRSKDSLAMQQDSSIHKIQPDSNKINQPGKDSSIDHPKVIPEEKNKTYWTAGIALQQSFGIDCHCAVNDGTVRFTDYLPSVYARWHGASKWFVQAEFKYSAPLYLDEFMYQRVIQNKPLNYFTTNYSLKKVHYHQLPLTFNYSISKHLSAGAGIRYNIFSSATSEVEVQKIIFGQAEDSLVSKVIVTDKNDSGFVSFKNYFQLLFEVQYQWKRFTLGTRCAVALQPYIKYYQPYLNIPDEKSSSSVDVFIRYELWRSRKHTKGQ